MPGRSSRQGSPLWKPSPRAESPVWAALKAGWSAASTEVKIATTLVLLLLIVLAPLALLGLLLTLLFLWIRDAVSGSPGR